MKICDDFSKYLKSTYYINWDDENIIKKAYELRSLNDDEFEIAKRMYYFVRDDIKHSWDVQDSRITVTATDVLREKVGICWAKANLLSALLRANGIPSGICYQRLTLGDTPDTGYCIHALNGVYLSSLNKWIRIDARGNKEGINADICIDNEKLAFPIRPHFNEIDYTDIYAEPLPLTMNVLENSTDAIYMYLHSLPDSIV